MAFQCPIGLISYCYIANLINARVLRRRFQCPIGLISYCYISPANAHFQMIEFQCPIGLISYCYDRTRSTCGT